MDTEKEFDSEFDLEAVTLAIVDQIKNDVKTKHGNKKRHKQ